jgi:molecular chaperone HtpG
MSQDTQKQQPVETFEFKAEMKQLLHLLIHSLYTHPEVFLRELISNASDALNKIRYRLLIDKNVLDADKELEIHIEVDEKEKTFAIRDSGIGMSRDELVNNIGTVARSGTLEFLKQIGESGKPGMENLIGRFGVGFYSVFMVTDEVTIETRQADLNSHGYRWRSSGEGNFTVEEIERAQRGTKISFKLKAASEEFAQVIKIKETIKKYSNFADFPIFVGGEKVNTVSALWRKNSHEIKAEELNEFYKFLTNEFEDPLGHLQVSIEGVDASFKALLFIPQSAPIDLMRVSELKSLYLYSNKILIMDDCKALLPEYLRFVKGVVDTADLPLNVSRETVQASPVMSRIRSTLVNKILAFLEGWANKDTAKYQTFYKNFGPLLKTGLHSDFSHRDKLIDLLRFETSSRPAGEIISLKEYVRQMKSEQKEIYYLSGEHRSALERDPNLEYFKKNQIEVLLLTDPVDIFIVPSIPAYDGKSVTSVEKADIELQSGNKIETPESNLHESLIKLFKETLGDKVEDVVKSKRLVESAVTLVAGKDGLDPQIIKMMRMMKQDVPLGKKILEINVEHPLIKNLARLYMADSRDSFLQKCIVQLYESALLINGDLPPATDFIKRMTEIMEKATK